MSRFAWLSGFLAGLHEEHILVRHGSAQDLAPAHLLEIDAEDWGRAGAQAAAFGCRWAALWGEQEGQTLLINACLEYQGDHLVLRTQVPAATPVLASHTPHYAAADRPERHTQDLLGIAFANHPDERRWTRHQAWAEDRFPLREDFPVHGECAGETPPDADYPFLQAKGSGVYEIPVGPVHAGIIEPGHFRFQAVGETILHLEEHLGYVHKGIEKIAVGRDPQGLARLAGRVSGDTTVGHAWAACMAMERAAGVELPQRAYALRAVLLERERIANHLGDIGAVCNDVGFAFAQYRFAQLRELWQRSSARIFGHRLMMDRVIPGGVAGDLQERAVAELCRELKELRTQLPTLMSILDEQESLQDRLVETGVLAPQDAAAGGALGYVARASGQDLDLRRDAPYPPYGTLEVPVPVFQEGDVRARLLVRAAEIEASMDLLERLMRRLPPGPVVVEWVPPESGAEGLGLVEGWRGEILCHVRFGADNRIRRFFPRDPSWLNWPLLERLMRGNIVPDFPVCNKSVNGSYSGQDL